MAGPVIALIAAGLGRATLPVLSIRSLLLLRSLTAIRRALWRAPEVTPRVATLLASNFPALIDALIGPLGRALIRPLINESLAWPLVGARPAAWVTPWPWPRIKP